MCFRDERGGGLNGTDSVGASLSMLVIVDVDVVSADAVPTSVVPKVKCVELGSNLAEVPEI